jgi:nucleoside-triphosphatase
VGRTLLLAGRPGVGKTTILQAVVSRLGDQAAGFYTEEVRQEGRRIGFRLVTLEGSSGWLARVDLRSRFRVGRYGVDLTFLEQAGVPALKQAVRERKLVVVDEIGKMELFSDSFRAAVLEAVDGPAAMLGTVMARPTGWVRDLLARPTVERLMVTPENRDRLPEHVWAWVQVELPVSVEP